MSDVEGDIDADDDDDDEIVFELADWTDAERTVLGDKLKAGGISHEWEDGDLVVADADADQAEEAIEAVEYPDQLPADSDEAPAAENEGSYEVMSALFVAADRLQHDPEDPVAGGEFDTAADSAADSGPPTASTPRCGSRCRSCRPRGRPARPRGSRRHLERRCRAAQLLSRYV